MQERRGGDPPAADAERQKTQVAAAYGGETRDSGTGQAAPREVELTLVAADADLLIRVRDTGPGIPHDMHEQIFTDGVTTKSSVTGARRGLGLALVRQITEGMGGMVSVGQDGGAVFTAVLPGCLDAPVPDAPLLDAALPDGQLPDAGPPVGQPPVPLRIGQTVSVAIQAR